jgi:predicted dehydrogenase
MQIAVIGLGSAGARHARNALALGHRVAGYDPGVAVDGVRGASSLEDALVGADAAIVASPSSMHVKHALAAVDAGVSVLVEKPLATNARDANHLVTVADERGVLCATAMNLRFHPALLLIRELLITGKLGRPLLATASFGYDLRLWRRESNYRRSYSARADLGGGVLLDAIHELDYLMWLLGPVASVQAMSGHLSDLEVDVEDAVVICLRFDSGVLATVDLNFFEPAYRRGCTIAGSDAGVTWDWTTSTVTLRHRDHQERNLVDGEVDATYVSELEDFLVAVRGEGSPRATGADGRAALGVVDAIRTAAAAGRAIAPVRGG